MFTDPFGPRLMAVILATAVAASAGAVEPSLEVAAPSGPVAVGDRVPVHVQAHGDGGMWGELTVRVSPDGPWAVVDGPREIEGSRPPAWELILVPLKVEQLALPEMTTTLRSEDGAVRTVAPVAASSVNVASVLPPDQEVEPAPLRNPLGVHGFPWEWVVPILLVLIPALAIQHWWLRRRRDRSIEDETSHLPPLEQLEVLVRELSETLGVTPAEQVCDRLASGFRRYLERRTGEPALEMTSFELRVLARDRRWPEPVQRALHRVMQVADGVRFGRRILPVAELLQAITAALDGAGDLERHMTPAESESAVEVAS